MKDENQSLTETNQLLKDELINILDKLTDPETREKIFSLADALMGGKPVIPSGGGGGSDSDFRWDGRRPDEEEEIYKRRCLIAAVKYVKTPIKKSYRR